MPAQTCSGAYLIYPLLWEHKAINAKNWRALERDGLEKTFPQYAAQVALYQAYLDITNPALFTALNADTCERLHFLVPFNAERAQLWSDRAVTSSKQRAPASCCRAPTTIRRIGTAACAATTSGAGDELPSRSLQKPCLAATSSGLGIEQRWRARRDRARNAARAGNSIGADFHAGAEPPKSRTAAA